jgi:ketosteroid isomerase-like protein
VIPSTPEQAVEMVDRAFNEGDIETVLNFYEDGAVVVTEPGKIARGKGELRSFFEQVLASKLSARQMKTYVLEADGIALFLCLAGHLKILVRQVIPRQDGLLQQPSSASSQMENGRR